MLDPRVEENAKKIKELEDKIGKIQKALWIVTNNLDGVAWRVSTEEERRAGVEIAHEIAEIIEWDDS